MEEIDARGGRATHVVADVAVPEEMDRVADVAIREFGGFDTWVNNAGISIYGRLIDVPMEDKKRLFDTNFWGVVNGCRTAVRYFARPRRDDHQHRQRRVRSRDPAAGDVLGVEACGARLHRCSADGTRA